MSNSEKPKLHLLTKEDQKLRASNSDIDIHDPQLPILIDEMFEKMYEWHGIGLAAPQMGINKRLAVVDIGDGDKIVLINPVITFESKDTNLMEEGCLNFPGEYYFVRRPKKIRIKYEDLQGNIVKRKASGLLAKALQHETDHLNRILIFDRKTQP